ncbi:VC1465 family Xer recombination activation factor [Pseudorhodoferax sp.]|uniref:VC1465 family Xer recombination activation factor n=1 Tax=Pseudorhodoferax sp. TaxID=1993553 RepID=UPI0039E6FAB5
MYLSLGMDLGACAQFLQVSRRTLHNWQSGKHAIPFAVFKLLRLLNRMDLPGPSWDGWYFVGGKLVSPEGCAFVGTDGSWWSLLVRRAQMFDVLYRENSRLRAELAGAVPRRRAAADGRTAVRAAAAPQAPGLVTVSTTHAVGDFDISADIGLTPNPGAARILMSYQIDHGLMSCPTLSAFPKTSMSQPVSGRPQSGSASTPSSAFASMPTSTAQASHRRQSPPSRGQLPGQTRHVGRLQSPPAMMV